MRRRRYIRDERLLGLTKTCSECGRTMKSTGEALHDDGVARWMVGFQCPYDDDFAIWRPEFQPVLDEVTRGIDPSTLPFLGTAQK